MLYVRDADGTQRKEILASVDFSDHHVLEVGCGEGFITWAYAPLAAKVTAIDPSAEDIEVAIHSRPAALSARIDFRIADIRDYSPSQREERYDIALFAWSL